MREIILSQHGRQITTYVPERISNSGSKHGGSHSSSKEVAVSRAKTLMKRKIFLNPQLNVFVTLTYRNQNATPQMIINDLKNLFTRNRVAYVAVIEHHKSGALHIHAICENSLSLGIHRNKYGYLSVDSWHKGFSNARPIKNGNSMPAALYIAKYVSKDTEKIAGHYFLTSRGLLDNVNKQWATVPDTVFWSNFHHELPENRIPIPENIRVRNTVPPYIVRKFSATSVRCKIETPNNGHYFAIVCYNESVKKL